jgi:hypothetical protein
MSYFYETNTKQHLPTCGIPSVSIDIVSERTHDSGLISPHLRSFLEDISETVCSAGSMNGNVSKYLYGNSEMMKAQDIISKEVADWLELNENDNYWAPRRQLRQKVSLITNVIQFTT